jgi:hypothetical protein
VGASLVVDRAGITSWPARSHRTAAHRLGDNATQVLRVGAVIGRSFEAELVEAVLGRDVLDTSSRR